MIQDNIMPISAASIGGAAIFGLVSHLSKAHPKITVALLFMQHLEVLQVSLQV